MKKFLLTILAVATLCSTVSFGGCTDAAEPAAKLPAASESLVLTETENDDIVLMSETIPVEDYETYGVAETVEIAKTLTATLSPAYAADKRVDYTAQWVNADSTWATGKTVSDYVTITQETDGALTALLTCKQAFGEQIKVTVSARSNPSAQATCTLDFAKRIKYASAHIFVGAVSGTPTTVQSFFGHVNPMTWSYADVYEEDIYYYGDGLYALASYTVGTIDDSFTNIQVSIAPTEVYKAAFSGAHEVENYTHGTVKCTLSSFGKNEATYEDSLYYGNTLPLLGIKRIYHGNYDVTEEEMSAWKSAAYTALQSLGGEPFLKITITAEGQHSSFSQTQYIYADVSTLPAVESVDVETTSFVF